MLLLLCLFKSTLVDRSMLRKGSGWECTGSGNIKRKRRISDSVLWQSPYTSRNVKRAKWQDKQRHKKFNYTTVADRLRTVSWSNYGHPTGVILQFTQIIENENALSMSDSEKREKGRELTQSYKRPYTHRKIQKATWQHKNATINFDNTKIADGLRTVSWSNSSYPTGVVKPVYERSTFPLTATAV